MSNDFNRNASQFNRSQDLLGEETVAMLQQVHADALWILENIGVGCKEPAMQEAFRQHEADGDAIIYEDRVYITTPLVQKCLDLTPRIGEFFVPLNSFFIGGTAPYVYDDENKAGGVLPTPEHVARIAQIAEKNKLVTGMGRGVKLQNEIEQIGVMTENCTKPIYFAITSDETLAYARDVQAQRGKFMVVFCLTRPALQVNENFSSYFVKVVQAGLPVAISAMPLAGISAPYCYSGVLTMTHAEVLFGICASQLLNPGASVVHAGFPTIADPRYDYNPNYGLKSHFLLNILMSHLNMILDVPTFQSIATTNEEHVTPKALEDARIGQAIAIKYGFHMMRHPFGFLRHLIDFSFDKLEQALRNAESVSADDAPELEMPVYDARGLESIQRIQLGMYMDDSLTTANIGKVFVD